MKHSQKLLVDPNPNAPVLSIPLCALQLHDVFTWTDDSTGPTQYVESDEIPTCPSCGVLHDAAKEKNP